MTPLLLVRDAQTVSDEMDQFQGRMGLSLNETGRQRAEAVARRIAADYRPIAWYSSPLRRAVQTTEAIARHVGISPQLCEGLVDLD